MRYGITKSNKPWELTEDFLGLSTGLDTFFDKFAIPVRNEWSINGKFMPAVDVQETDSHYFVSMDVPGLEKGDIRIEVKNDQLLISGERKDETIGGEKGNLHVERNHGKFQRIFTLPSDVDGTAVEANHKNGVLQVAIPKAEKKMAKVIPIKEDKEGFFNRLVGKKNDKAPQKAD